MHLRRLPGVHRPGIAIIVPTLHGPVLICDVGANVNCRPQHLHQYAVMSMVYGQEVAGLNTGRVGLLSIGEEDAKGNQLVKQTRELLRDDPNIHFTGNVEGRDLFTGACDVIVCEGFVGNVCLKLMEGMAEGLFAALAVDLKTQGDQGKMALMALKGAQDRFDYNEYGGAPLLGVNGVVIICHGSSNRRAIYNAVRVSRDFATRGVNPQITRLLGERSRVMDG
jgi:glycerol-3-phosphate acyltransferase PlsX